MGVVIFKLGLYIKVQFECVLVVANDRRSLATALCTKELKEVWIGTVVMTLNYRDIFIYLSEMVTDMATFLILLELALKFCKSDLC